LRADRTDGCRSRSPHASRGHAVEGDFSLRQ
jgi:hypothetical protein